MVVRRAGQLSTAGPLPWPAADAYPTPALTQQTNHNLESRANYARTALQTPADSERAQLLLLCKASFRNPLGSFPEASESFWEALGSFP